MALSQKMWLGIFRGSWLHETDWPNILHKYDFSWNAALERNILRNHWESTSSSLPNLFYCKNVELKRQWMTQQNGQFLFCRCCSISGSSFPITLLTLNHTFLSPHFRYFLQKNNLIHQLHLLNYWNCKELSPLLWCIYNIFRGICRGNNIISRLFLLYWR